MISSYLSLVLAAQNVGNIAFFLTAFFGFIVIFSTLFLIRKIFGAYKYLMILFTVLGIILAGFETIFHLNIHFYNNGIVFFTPSAPFGFSKDVMSYFLPAYPGLYCMTVSLLAVHFIYRYWALFDVHRLSYFQGWNFMFWIIYCLFFGLIWYFHVLIILETDPVSAKYFVKEMYFRYNISNSKIAMLMFLPFDPDDGSTRWTDISYTIIITIVMGYQYGTMMYCGWKMHSKMEEKLENLSSNLKHHHRQLFRTLVLQISAPTIFLFSPLVLVLYLPYFHFELSIPAGCLVCLFSFYPAMDSIIVLVIVTEYRRSAKKLWNTMSGKSKVQSVSYGQTV